METRGKTDVSRLLFALEGVRKTMREKREALCGARQAVTGDVILLPFALLYRWQDSSVTAYTNTVPLSIRAEGPQSTAELDTTSRYSSTALQHKPPSFCFKLASSLKRSVTAVTHFDTNMYCFVYVINISVQFSVVIAACLQDGFTPILLTWIK